MPIAIKILNYNDVDILRNVAPDVFDDAIDLQRAEEFLADPRHHLAVAIEDELVVGFVSAVQYVHPDKPRPEMWINEVSVSNRQDACSTKATGKMPVPQKQSL